MRVGGIWKLTVKTPKGTLSPVLTLTEVNNTITGTMLVAGNPKSRLTHGKLNGAAATMKGSIRLPMPTTLNFEVEFDGDTLAGTCANKIAKPFPTTGVRVGDAPKPDGWLVRWKEFLFD